MVNLANRNRAEIYFGAACLTGAATSLLGAYVHYVGRSTYSDVVLTFGILLAVAFVVLFALQGGKYD